MADSTTGAAIGSLVTGIFAAVVAYLNHRAKQNEVDTDARIRPQLAFYEDLMTRVRTLEESHAELSRDRDELNRQLNAALARCTVLEERVAVLSEASVRKDIKIESLREQRNHYRRLAQMGEEELRLSGLRELGETLSDAISDADEANSLTGGEHA